MRQPSLTNKLLYTALLLCSAIAFVLTLSVYALWNGRNPLNRIGYGVFISLVPALLTLVAAKIVGLRYRMSVVGVYFAFFVLLVILQGVIR